MNYLYHTAFFVCMVQLMATQRKGLSGSRWGGDEARAVDGDAIDVVETEMAVLARTLESLSRRSDIFRDLDRASYLIARTLEGTGPVSINGLASALGLDATTVTRQVATMQSRRLVTRRSDPKDGRVRLVTLSEEGRRKMRAVQAERKARLAEMLSGWSDDDCATFGRLLVTFNKELKGALAQETFSDAE